MALSNNVLYKSILITKIITFTLMPIKSYCADIVFGMTADPHMDGSVTNDFKSAQSFFRDRQVDFAMDLGDLAIQTIEGDTTEEAHDAQLAALIDIVDYYEDSDIPVYYTIGNHDAGWIDGWDEEIMFEDLIDAGNPHGEHITKQELIDVTGIPDRYYSFDIGKFHMIVLDGNNPPDPFGSRGVDGVEGSYWIDDAQLAWLEADLASHPGKPKIVFSHQELHFTPEEGGEGGQIPFPQYEKFNSYVDNGWQVRQILESDGEVVAVFQGHKHQERWTIRNGIPFFTLRANNNGGPFGLVTISDDIQIEIFYPGEEIPRQTYNIATPVLEKIESTSDESVEMDTKEENPPELITQTENEKTDTEIQEKKAENETNVEDQISDDNTLGDASNESFEHSQVAGGCSLVL